MTDYTLSENGLRLSRDVTRISELEAEVARLKKQADTWEWAIAAKDRQIGEFADEVARLTAELAEATEQRNKIAISFLESHKDAQEWRDRAVVAEAELAEARKDAERLDWIGRRADDLSCSGYGADDKWWTLFYCDGNTAQGNSPRAAIDAARKETPDAR